MYLREGKQSLLTIAFLSLSLLALWGLSFHSNSRPANSDLIHLSQVHDEYPVSLAAEYLLTDQSVGAEKIASPEFEQDWKPYTANGIVRGNSNSQLWLRFNVVNQSSVNTNWWMVLAWSMIEHATVSTYNSITHQWWHSRAAGKDYPLQSRYVKHRFLIYPLSFHQHETLTYYVNIRSTNLLSVPVSIWNSEAFISYSQIELIALGAIIGGLFIMLLYNLSLHLLLKDKAYLYYCVYVASVIVYLIAITGLGSYYFWDSSVWIKKYSFLVTSIATFMAAILFCRKFLMLKAHGGWLLVGNNFLIVMWVGLAISVLFDAGRALIPATTAASFITCIIASATALELCRRNYPAAKLFALSWGALIAGTVIFILALQGTLPLNNFTRYSQMFGFVAELVLLSVALAYRINHEIDKRELAQSEALLLTKKVSEERRERLKAKMETLAVQRNLNEELESHVIERTEQLKEAMEKLEHANAELTKLSVTDSLTKVHNRRYFDDTFIDEYKRALRGKHTLAVIVVDIDHFKSINDNYGHSVGDSCIALVANTLKDVIHRPGDLVARYGGEEFVFLLPHSDEANAMALAAKCRQAIEDLDYKVGSHRLPLTVSAGVAAWIPTEEGAYKQLINAADTALYRAKNAGRNCVKSASERGKLAQI